VRRTFLSQTDARLWEIKVLRRMSVVNNLRWLNKSVGNSDWFGKSHSEESKQKMSDAKKRQTCS
jgi:hypothetical protein